MKDEKKTKAQLIQELKAFRQRNIEPDNPETDHKRTEEALKESEEKFRLIFDSVLDGILIADVESKKFFMGNRSICRMLGYTEEEIGNLGVMDIHPPEDLSHVIEQFEKQARKEIEVAKDIPVKRKDGKIVYVEIVSSMMKLGEKLYLLGMFRDITERKAAEEALREQLHFLGQLIENIPIPIFYKDIHGLFRGCNTAFEKLVGLTKEQVIGKTVHGVYPQDLADIYDRADSGLFYQPGVQVYETSFPHADGSRHDIIFNKATYIDADGQVAGLIGAILDITEQKRAKETLQESEERFRRVFEEGPLGMCIAGPDFCFTKVNEAFCRMIGYTEQELAVLTFKDITHPDHIAQDIDSVKKLMVGEIPIYRTEKRYLRKDGETVWAAATITAIKDLNGRALYFLSLIEDITERKRGEEALRLSEEKFSKAFKTSPDSVNINRLSDGLYLDINESFTKNTGYTREDVIGRSSLPGDLGIWVRQEDRDKLVASLKATGEAIGLEAPFRRKDGSVLYGRMSARVLEINGELCILSITSDITERKRAEVEKRKLEEQLQRAEKMEALGTLAGGVAHDLNNVLGIIVGYSELLLYDIEGSSPLKPGLMNILGGSQKAAAIVQDLLTLARRGVASRKVINLNQIIVDYRNSPEFENLSSYHSSIKITTDLEPDLLNISGSAVHLGKMLFNLASNASEAMPKGGVLTIKTSNQYLDRPIQGYDEVREGDYVVLSVSDTGEGIPAADLKRIFEPFYTKKVMGRSGTGLGLAVVWGTVKDHYGYINVQSEEGKGSTFTLYFPVTREEVTAEEVAVSIFEYLGKGETILIVDDVKGQRDLAEEMLTKLNYMVKSVSSGEEAVAYLKEHKVDLLVLDMIMDPGLDGLDTYKKILEICPRQKAIIVSGFSESDRVHTAQTLGAGAYVRKPYVLEKIGLAVRRELDK